MFVSLIASLGVVLLLALPPSASAQIQFPPRVADSVATCVTGNIPSLLSEAAFTEPIDGGWRVMIPLAGQSEPDLSMQTPPPSNDELSWMDLYLFPNSGAVDAVVNNFDSYVIVTATGGAMFVQQDGYYMLILRSVGQQCVERATGGTFEPR